ncbi:hypothetical protein Zm00014a_027758 [Zea mays]|uniref:Uncharacterized protein n=1 Tax=Zea mays TaxID=4577 RepID=A0A3L6G3P1_MAIZE|nr:hypothetical protein Zm00014a_027758 [Zea mays]
MGRIFVTSDIRHAGRDDVATRTSRVGASRRGQSRTTTHIGKVTTAGSVGNGASGQISSGDVEKNEIEHSNRCKNWIKKENDS